MALPYGCHMASLEECKWHESHVVWHFPPSACVHVTHGIWSMDHESERKFPLTWIKPRNILGEKKEFGVGKEKKRKEKKRKERIKIKERRKKKRNEERKKKERKTKERRKKNTCMGKKEKRGKKGK